jgi:hypothetical protein
LHVLGCEVCKPEVWRSSLDARVVDAMGEILEGDDEDLRRRAASVLAFPETVGITASAERRARFTERVDELLSA